MRGDLSGLDLTYVIDGWDKRVKELEKKIKELEAEIERLKETKV